MIKAKIATLVEQALAKAKQDGLLQFETAPPVEIEPPRNKAFGDFSTNVAMLLRAQVGGDPRQIAETIAGEVRTIAKAELSKVEIAGGGFINFTLNPAWLASSLSEILAQGADFGGQNLGNGQRVLLEYVSANPTGPIHIAHARGGVVGDVLARLLTMLGYSVHREFYINDATNSTQMNEFAKSLYLRYKQLLGEPIDTEALGYRGEYMVELAEEVRRNHGDKLAEGAPEEAINRFRDIGQEMVLRNQKQDLADFGIEFDQWYSEQSLHDRDEVTNVLEALKQGGYTYESENALWLRTKAFGDEKDRVLVRNNGAPTYIAADAAYHRDKLERGFDLLIDIWGPDHHGYIARTKAAIGSLGYSPDQLKILIYQIVKLYRGNEEVRLSKRTGNVITLREVLDEVGRDVTRFFLLMRSHDTDLNFNLELAKQQSDENPVYYVQYAHARISSVIRRAAEAGFALPNVADVDLTQLTHEAELELVKKIAALPDEIVRVTELYEPHRLTGYAQDLARTFHLFYDACRVLSSERVPVEPALTNARLVLCDAARLALRNTLGVLGVSAPDQMDQKETA